MTEAIEFHLLNDYQRDFPLVPTPFAAIAHKLDITEQVVLDTLRELQTHGSVSRVGAVFRPHRVGYSALAAMAVPEDQLAQAAQMVNESPAVNHNYQREHTYNLWFVVTAANEDSVLEALHGLERRLGYTALYLPMLEDYHIDLGFNMRTGHHGATKASCAAKPNTTPFVPSDADRALIAAVQSGMPLVSQPYAALGEQAGLSEEDVLQRLCGMMEQDVIKRFGVVVRHQELGFHANAMVVFDIPDGQVAGFGQCVGEAADVTLCYRRPRRLPAWRYNLFCMIHGRDRDAVLERIEAIRQECGLQAFPHEILFSCRRFKQRGAHYVAPAEAVLTA